MTDLIVFLDSFFFFLSGFHSTTSNRTLYQSLRRGFRQQTRGPDTGAFHHPLFRRDQPELCLEMECPGLGDDVERKRVRLTTVRNGDLGSFNTQRAGGSVLQPSVSRPRKVFVIPELAISYDTPPGFGRREADTRRRRRATTKLTGASSRG